MVDIVSKLYKALQNPISYNKRKNNSLYPSSASIQLNDGTVYGTCLRASYYRYTNTSEDTVTKDPELELISLNGESLHNLLGSLFKQLTFQTKLHVITLEQSVYCPVYNISGRSDAVFYDEDTNTIVGCDFKTVGEYKAGTVIDQPDINHILQCMIYLYLYQTYTTKEYENINEWIILYLSRNDTYRTKHKRHGSQFRNLWQFSLTLDPTDQHAIITNMYGVKQHYNNIKLPMVLQRYAEIESAVSISSLPNREYEFQYSEEKLVTLAKEKKLNKEQTKIVDDWLAAGAKDGKLLEKIDIGDFECRMCPWLLRCYSNQPNSSNVTPSLLRISHQTETKTNNNKFII